MSNLPVPNYYDQFTAKERSYVDYMGEINKSISSEIETSANRQIAANAMFVGEIKSTLINNQIATEKAVYNGMQELNGTLYAGFSDVSNQVQSGFSNVSREIGVMNAVMSMGFASLNSAVQESAQAICDKLDTMNDILNNPSLTKTRELFRRASTNFNKGFYEEAKDDLLEALNLNKTDYISWFLLGKTYLFGVSEFSTVIDLDESYNALKNAIKYIKPDVKNHNEARLMAAEICFYLGLSLQTKAMDMFHANNSKESRNYLDQAIEVYNQSWDYSSKMLESKYNLAGCKVVIGDVHSALEDLNTIILCDPLYYLKVVSDSDFDNIRTKVDELLNKLKVKLYPQAKECFEQINNIRRLFNGPYSPLLNKLISEQLPKNISESTPPFDILVFTFFFSKILSLLQSEKKETDNKNENRKNECRKILASIEKYYCRSCPSDNSSGYEYRKKNNIPVPPSLVETLVYDIYSRITNDLNENICNSLSLRLINEAFNIYINNDWKKIAGLRPWVHWNFINSLSSNDRELLAEGIFEHINKNGVWEDKYLEEKKRQVEQKRLEVEKKIQEVQRTLEQSRR